MGESGSGKSVSTMALLGLIPMPPGRIASGGATFKGEDLLGCPRSACGSFAVGEMAMIFQDPMTSLNPVFTIGDQIIEALLAHHPDMKDDAARERTIHCSRRSASRTPSGASTSIHTSSRAACASGR